MNVNDDDGSKYDENWNYDIYDDNGDAGLNINAHKNIYKYTHKHIQIRT